MMLLKTDCFLEGQDLPHTYLAYHELDITVVISALPQGNLASDMSFSFA